VFVLGAFVLTILSLPAAGAEFRLLRCPLLLPTLTPASKRPARRDLEGHVEVVQLFFNVKDKHGALIPNLNKENFSTFVRRRPAAQTIKYLQAESDLPLTSVSH